MRILHRVFVFLGIITYERKTKYGYSGVKPVRANPLLFLVLLIGAVGFFFIEGGKAFFLVFVENYKKQ